tara:strand:+ start:369 stop:1241 length:873 start_codon:yes stop_codon:yes gene_type:complete
MSTKKLSIIIPTLNRPDQLNKLVDKIMIYAAPEVEVILVDDSLERWKGADAETFKEGKINYIHRARKLGVSSARNIGAFHANGRYLIFLDDDDGFTSDWLVDFAGKLESNPDLVFCNMRRTEPNGAQSTVTSTNYGEGGRGNGIVIPGAWMIRKSCFIQLGGFDERLLYAENTEFFIRVDKLNLSRQFIPKVNFLYNPSPTGGSKNLQNMIDSLSIILDTHQDTLSTHVKYLYHQIIGVNQMRFRRYSEARKHLLLALSFKPLKAKTISRYCISLIPPLAKIFYPEKVQV